MSAACIRFGACALLLSALLPGCGGSGSATNPPSPTPSAPARSAVCAGNGPGVVIVVEPALAAASRASLTGFEQDLCGEGYAVTEAAQTFASPADLRSFLAAKHAESGGRLEGALLVGDHPHAYQWVTLTSSNPNIPSTSEEVLSYQYYADIDGRFAASSGYRSPAGRSYSFDVHDGDVDWELWVGVLPRYEGDLTRTTQALDRYFRKNHDYRRGEGTLPRGLLQVNELNKASSRSEHDSLLSQMRAGPYSWTPWSSSASARLYFDSPPGGLSVDQGYADLGAGTSDFTVQDSHGYWGASGRLDITWVETRPVRTTFFWSNGCAVGDLDRPANFLTSIVYGPSSLVLVAKGTTNNSGGMGTNAQGFFGHNVAVAMSNGESVGRAILGHVNVPLVEPWASAREFHFATSVLLGDPTLKLR